MPITLTLGCIHIHSNSSVHQNRSNTGFTVTFERLRIDMMSKCRVVWLLARKEGSSCCKQRLGCSAQCCRSRTKPFKCLVLSAFMHSTQIYLIKSIYLTSCGRRQVHTHPCQVIVSFLNVCTWLCRKQQMIASKGVLQAVSTTCAEHWSELLSKDIL